MTEAVEGNNAFMVADLEPKAPVEESAVAAALQTALNTAAAQPPKPDGEDADTRMARLRALAQIEIDKESDQEVVARIVAEERAKRAEALLPKDTSGWPADYDKIEIFEGKSKEDPQYVTLGLNGYTIKVPRGAQVILPHVFVSECLDHAVEDVTIRSQGGLITRPVKRFPYSFVGKATADEYKAFQAEQRELASRQQSAFDRMSA